MLVAGSRLESLSTNPPRNQAHSMRAAVFPLTRRKDQDDIPLPPGQEPRAPVEDPPDSPQVEPPAPVREPEDNPDRRIAAPAFQVG